MAETTAEVRAIIWKHIETVRRASAAGKPAERTEGLIDKALDRLERAAGHDRCCIH